MHAKISLFTNLSLTLDQILLFFILTMDSFQIFEQFKMITFQNVYVGTSFGNEQSDNLIESFTKSLDLIPTT